MKMFRVVVNGSEYKVGIEELAEENPPQPTLLSPAPPAVSVNQQPRQAAAKRPGKLEPPVQETHTDGETITAPMPGTIIKVTVDSGTSVSMGQTLLILEAMKMENEIKAPMAGTIKEIKTSQGTSVNAGDILIVLAP